MSRVHVWLVCRGSTRDRERERERDVWVTHLELETIAHEAQDAHLESQHAVLLDEGRRNGGAHVEGAVARTEATDVVQHGQVHGPPAGIELPALALAHALHAEDAAVHVAVVVVHQQVVVHRAVGIEQSHAMHIEGTHEIVEDARRDGPRLVPHLWVVEEHQEAGTRVPGATLLHIEPHQLTQPVHAVHHNDIVICQQQLPEGSASVRMVRDNAQLEQFALWRQLGIADGLVDALAEALLDVISWLGHVEHVGQHQVVGACEALHGIAVEEDLRKAVQAVHARLPSLRAHILGGQHVDNHVRRLVGRIHYAVCGRGQQQQQRSPHQ